MGLETGDYISDLDPNNPLGTDDLSQADDHMRLIKKTVQQSFPNIDGEVVTGVPDMNAVVGLAAALSGRFLALDWFNTANASGLWTPPAPPADIHSVLIAVWGAGGGAGGTGGAAGNDRSGGGGGSGAMALSWLKGTAIPWDVNDQVPYSVGLGGAAGTPFGAVTGGSSWFGATNFVQADGGAGGSGGENNAGAGGTGGLNSIGQLQLRGGNGGRGPLLPSGAVSGGAGGCAPWFGTHTVAAGEGNGLNAYLPAQGGSGGARQSVSSSGTVGGSGSDGALLLISFGGKVT